MRERWRLFGWCRQVARSIAVLLVLTRGASAQFVAPIHGHYPPGQTGLRGAAAPEPGWTVTSFNRLFSNLDAKDQDGNTAEAVNQSRYANISMIGWTSDYQVLGMNFGALVGIPFATGNLNPDNPTDSSFGLGDIIVTPISLTGSAPTFDYQFQFSVWTPSGKFQPGGSDNRGSGFWSVIYTAGGVWYPGGDRKAWSLSGVARIEQNFDQAYTGITPGDNFDIDWGIARMVEIGNRNVDIGVSGFGTWQITRQSAGPNTSPYRYLGAGPEISVPLAGRFAARVRAQWEFGARNVVQGNNIWVILNARL